MTTGCEALLRKASIEQMVAALQDASGQPDTHEAAVRALARLFAEHFPAFCELIAETIRTSGHQRFHYWCDVAEMTELANYHFVLDGAPVDQ